jgi:hypothetical protein
MKNKIWYNKALNELQFYDKSIAVKAFKNGLDVYATKGLNTSINADDYKITSVDAIINIEQALFIVEAVTFVEAKTLIESI